MIMLYGLKNCDICKKVMKVMDVVGIVYIFVDICVEVDLLVKVLFWLEVVGVKVLVNICLMIWCGLDEDQ